MKPLRPRGVRLRGCTDLLGFYVLFSALVNYTCKVTSNGYFWVSGGIRVRVEKCGDNRFALEYRASDSGSPVLRKAFLRACKEGPTIAKV